ncbi:MAG: M81 family metallopeptidase [Phycisphaera sp. RhM]|nr:M81 family metallopeptidase [Phycisphaera sp. RhM]
MRIGIIALLHESNTFSFQPTTLESFHQNLLLTGESIRTALADTHHEVGGFFAGIDESIDASVNAGQAEAVPLFAARALPSGTIRAEAFDSLVSQLLDCVRESPPLDGILVAPHGATVSENYPDADGHWLSELRQLVGPEIPIIGTLDAHANLSPLMVESCTALIAYRTNPHLDQRERGLEAANMILRTLRGAIVPVMSACFPPMAISIEKQCTEEPPLDALYRAANEQLKMEGVLSNSILLGFPYADVEELGAATIAVTDGRRRLASQLADELASSLWQLRTQFCSEFTSVDEAIRQCEQAERRVCLLDMGDNVGGGSAADGTDLLGAIHAQEIGPSFGCLYDPESVASCDRAGVGSTVRLRVGGKTDAQHGDPIEVTVKVISLCDGKFCESEPRHGGITDFDQGRTAVCETDRGLTLMLTSRRMVPFSLQQLRGCGVDPMQFRILVAKGVNAPIAAYREVCASFIRVNTRGATCADLSRLTYKHRRRPMFPMDPESTQ